MAYSSPTTETISQSTNLLKRQYYIDETLYQLFNNYSLFDKMFVQGKEGQITVRPDGGFGFVYPIMLSGNASFAVRGDMKVLPAAQAPSFGQITGNLWFAYARARVSGQLQILARDEKYAYLGNTQARVLKQLPKDFAKMFGQMCYRDGSGALARINATNTDTTSSGTALVVDANHSTGVGSATSGYTFGTKHLRTGMEIGICDDAGTRAGVRGKFFGSADLVEARTGNLMVNQVDSVVSATSFFTEADLDHNSENQYIIIGNNGTNGDLEEVFSTTQQLEITGLNLHFSATETVHGIAKTNAYWQPAAMNGAEGGDAAFSWSTHVMTNVRAIEDALGPDAMGMQLYGIVSPALLDRIASEFDNTTRTSMTEFNKAYGYNGVKARRAGVEVQFIADTDAPDGTILFLDPKAFVWQEAAKPHILNELTGQDWYGVDNYHAAELMFGTARELVCLNPKRCAVQYGIATT